MQKTWWSVTQDFGDYKVENMLFTYDDNEQQEHLLDKMNAEVVLNPGFIPLNPRMLQKGYSFVEASIFGFLQFFLTNNEKFYCTNEQMWKMLNVNEKTISLAITKLKDNWLIKLSYKMKGGGWKIRFIHLSDDITKSNVGTLQNVKYDITKSNDIYNKNINNKKIINNNPNSLPKPESNITPITNRDLTFDNIYNLFYHKSWHKPSLDKCKKVFESLNLDTEWYNMLVKDLKLFRVEYKYWVKDQKYRPWFEKYVGWFNAEWVNEEYRLKTIVKFHMENCEDIEKWKKRYLDLCESFWKDVIDKLVKEYGKTKNKITLKAD